MLYAGKSFLIRTVIIALLQCCHSVYSAPVTNDIWDISQGIVITGNSPIYSGFSVKDIFGNDPTKKAPEPGLTIFADGSPAGAIHWVEWETPKIVQLKSFDLYAGGDGPPNSYLCRTINHFTLKAKSSSTGDYDTIYEGNVTIPYNNGNPQKPNSLHLSHAFSAPVTAKYFRAEFRQGMSGFGPRIIELDGFAANFKQTEANQRLTSKSSDNIASQTESPKNLDKTTAKEFKDNTIETYHPSMDNASEDVENQPLSSDELHKKLVKVVMKDYRKPKKLIINKKGKELFLWLNIYAPYSWELSKNELQSVRIVTIPIPKNFSPTATEEINFQPFYVPLTDKEKKEFIIAKESLMDMFSELVFSASFDLTNGINTVTKQNENSYTETKELVYEVPELLIKSSDSTIKDSDKAIKLIFMSFEVGALFNDYPFISPTRTFEYYSEVDLPMIKKLCIKKKRSPVVKTRTHSASRRRGGGFPGMGPGTPSPESRQNNVQDVKYEVVCQPVIYFRFTGKALREYKIVPSLKKGISDYDIYRWCYPIEVVQVDFQRNGKVVATYRNYDLPSDKPNMKTENNETVTTTAPAKISDPNELSTDGITKPIEKSVAKTVTNLLTSGKANIGSGSLSEENNELTVFFDEVTKKAGYKDKKGNIVIKPIFSWGQDFHEGIAVVMPKDEDGKYGTIDEKGTFIVTPQYDSMNSFSEGLSCVALAQSSSGRVTHNEEKHKDASSSLKVSSSFNVRILGQTKHGYINKQGNMVIKLQYDDAKDFKEGLAPVKINSQWGYIDKKEEFIIEPKFADADSFSEGLARVMINNRYGYIDKNGSFVIAPSYEDALSFKGGKAGVLINGETRCIDKSGRFVQPDAGVNYIFSSINLGKE
jgi:hypothetical protein